MRLDYLPIFADMEELTEELCDEERGQLLAAMMAYAFHGEDRRPAGNARYIWPAVRRTLDQCMDKLEKKRQNGAKGGRPRQSRDEPRAGASSPEETGDAPAQIGDAPAQTGGEPNETGDAPARTGDAPAQTGQAHTKQQEQAQEHEQDHGQKHEHEHGQAQRQEQRARALAARYALPEGDVCVRALCEDIERHGEQAVIAALQAASQSNSRPKLSVNFYRAVLAGKGRGSPPRGALAPMQRYTQQERRETYSAAIVNLDLDE